MQATPNIAMTLNQRIDAFADLGRFFNQVSDENNPAAGSMSEKANEILAAAEAENGWFTRQNILAALQSWAGLLTEENLQQWLSKYNLPAVNPNPKTVGIVMAGNVPMVGFHDFLSVLITGNKVQAKLASGDRLLIPFFAEFLKKTEPGFSGFIEFTEERLTDFDAIIATGSDNTARYFEYYFKKYPHIIRKNRNSVAVLTGKETGRDLELLADDIFRHFGLGCRNVSKIYIPEGYNFDPFFKAMYSWKHVINHHRYINNYDYNKAVYLMDNLALLDNEFLLLKEDSGFSSPIAVVFYEYYSGLSRLASHLEEQADRLQCIVADLEWHGEVAFGKTQSPELWEYADGVDTIRFLEKL